MCRVADRVVAGDHAVVLAEPLLAQAGRDDSPLLYHQGRYACLAPVVPLPGAVA